MLLLLDLPSGLSFSGLIPLALTFLLLGSSGLLAGALRPLSVSQRGSLSTTITPRHATIPTSVDSDYFRRPGPWNEPNLDSLLSANKIWSNRMIVENPAFFEEIKKGHAPKILWIGCSDARVPVNEMIGEPPGSVFITRNIANMVINTDINTMSVIQYAVDVLKVKHIVVCGHYDCGGVRAALEAADHQAPLENWLRNIRDIVRLHKDEISSIDDLTIRQRRLVELNVQEQCLNIFKTAVVQRRRKETHQLREDGDPDYLFTEPRVHGFVYEPTNGECRRLELDFSEIWELKDVYDLYAEN